MNYCPNKQFIGIFDARYPLEIQPGQAHLHQPVAPLLAACLTFKAPDLLSLTSKPWEMDIASLRTQAPKAALPDLSRSTDVGSSVGFLLACLSWRSGP